MARTKTAEKDKGLSLAKGPIALLGLAMIAWGIISFLMGGDAFTTDTPDGAVTGDTFLDAESNGWTNVLWVGGGVLLVLAAPMHWGAKTMAFIVGLVLAAAAIVSLADGPDVFGVLAANGTTQLLWGAVGIGLLVLALLPRVGRKKAVHEEHVADRDREHRHAERAEREADPVERRTDPVERRTDPVERRTDPVERRTDPVEREAYERGRRDAERERLGTAEHTGPSERDPDPERTAGPDDGTAERDRGGFRRL